MTKYELIGAMQVKNEADRYLREVLTAMNEYCDKIVVLDDASTDNTVEVCEEYGCIVEINEESLFEQEGQLKDRLWNQVLPKYAKINKSWIITVDADEIIDPRIITNKPQLFEQDVINLYLIQIYEFWGSKEQVRIDQLFNPTFKQTPMLARWLPETNYFFPPGLHCGRIPINQPEPIVPSGLWCKHFGWSNPEEHKAKIANYADIDSDNPQPQMKEHYQNIKYGKPLLVDWWLD